MTADGPARFVKAAPPHRFDPGQTVPTRNARRFLSVRAIRLPITLVSEREEKPPVIFIRLLFPVFYKCYMSGFSISASLNSAAESTQCFVGDVITFLLSQAVNNKYNTVRRVYSQKTQIFWHKCGSQLQLDSACHRSPLYGRCQVCLYHIYTFLVYVSNCSLTQISTQPVTWLCVWV